MRFSAACLALLVLTGALACTKEGPVRPAAADDERLVLTGQDDEVGLRLTIKPARPHAGDKVSWIAEMTVGDPPYARGGFSYHIRIDSIGGQSLISHCLAPASPRPSGAPKPRRQILRNDYMFLKSGPHEFSMSASTGCPDEPGNPGVEGTIDVLPPRPENTHRWSGSNHRWSVDLTALPRRPVELLDHVGFHLAIERTDDEPISWKISYGDGHDKVGGHACEPDAAGADEDRFERRYAHQYNRPAEFHVMVEVSNDCLRSSDARRTKVIDETLYLRPRPLRDEDAFFIPSHRSDDVPAGSLEDVDIAGDPSSRCVWLQRADGSRIAALWPAGFYARFDPLRVYNDKQAEVFREGKPRDVGGSFSSVHADRVPEECRVGDRVWWVDRLRRY